MDRVMQHGNIYTLWKRDAYEWQSLHRVAGKPTDSWRKWRSFLSHPSVSFISFFAQWSFFSNLATREIVHQISDNVFLGNQQGVLKYISAGERSANIYFQSNTLLYNGFYRYNSSSSSINFLLFQNAQRFYFGNNWLSRNLGGTYIQCYSQSLSSIFNGHIFNNVFYRNK